MSLRTKEVLPDPVAPEISKVAGCLIFKSLSGSIFSGSMALHWFNYAAGREFSFISSTLEPSLVSQLVDDGFYWMGDSDSVVCCGCFNTTKITMTTRLDHQMLVPDCFLLTLRINLNGQSMVAKVGMFSADQGLKELLHSHRRIYLLASRLRTFGQANGFALASMGFVKNEDESLECTYCHFLTTDTDENTLMQRHKKNRPNCIFIPHE